MVPQANETVIWKDVKPARLAEGCKVSEAAVVELISAIVKVVGQLCREAKYTVLDI